MTGLHKIDSKQFRNPFDNMEKIITEFNGPLKLCALIDLCNPIYILLITIIMELTKIIVLVL